MNTLFSQFAHSFEVLAGSFSLLLDVWFLVFPPLLFWLFKVFWVQHVEGQYASGIEKVLLEIIPPRDSEKSPLLMESIYAGLAGVETSPNTAEQWIKGQFPTSFSLEIVSTEGQVHFYVRSPKNFRNLVEAHFYAQYPGVEILEVEDYIYNVPGTVPNNEWDLWGTDFLLAGEDLYPIKTYKYFEETVTGKMIDPLAGLVESMAKIGPGQHLWLQFIVTPLSPKIAKELQGTIDAFLGKKVEEKSGIFGILILNLKDIVMNLGKGIMGQELSFSSSEGKVSKDESPVEFRLTPGEKERLKALESNIGKQMFRTRMRHVYVARRSVFDKSTGVSAFIGAIKQFNDQNLNGFKPNDDTKTYSAYIFKDERLRYRQRRLFRRYTTRDTDPQPTRFLLSSEELATVFHIPDMSITSPALTRVSSKRGGAPTNLPIQE
ncbi:MAG: hypothetical protein PHH40_01870 [Candidatus Moranbacteria bacterium]|nr:hypothetical protein [Candidatus Moranbacteria bacterium]MDD3965032.1 hypothetical protein [Candidatus Moranbacteria bacterium]